MATECNMVDLATLDAETVFNGEHHTCSAYTGISTSNFTVESGGTQIFLAPNVNLGPGSRFNVGSNVQIQTFPFNPPPNPGTADPQHRFGVPRTWVLNDAPLHFEFTGWPDPHDFDDPFSPSHPGFDGCTYVGPPRGTAGPMTLECSPPGSWPNQEVFVPQIGECDEQGACDLFGTGEVAGFPGIETALLVDFLDALLQPLPAQLVHSYDNHPTTCDLPAAEDWGDFLGGTLTLGTAGGLPTGEPIVFGFQLTLPFTVSNVVGFAPAGSSWLLITADKDAAAVCSITAPTTSCVGNGIADSNFSDTSTITSRRLIEGPIFDATRSYFHFTLPILPPGTTVDQAYINLMDVENSITPTQDSIPIGIAAAPWITNTITWNNQPNPDLLDGAIDGVFITPFKTQFEWRGHSASIHPYINDIYSGSAENNGFVLGVGPGKHSRGFRSANTGFDAPRLYLRVISPIDLTEATVFMPPPPADSEVASQVFICDGVTPPTNTGFSVE